MELLTITYTIPEIDFPPRLANAAQTVYTVMISLILILFRGYNCGRNILILRCYSRSLRVYIFTTFRDVSSLIPATYETYDFPTVYTIIRK